VDNNLMTYEDVTPMGGKKDGDPLFESL